MVKRFEEVIFQILFTNDCIEKQQTGKINPAVAGWG